MVLVVGKTVKMYYVQNTGQLSEQCMYPTRDMQSNKINMTSHCCNHTHSIR